MTDIVTTLERQEQELVFDAFDHAHAWRLGTRITAIAQEAGHKVGIDIRRPGRGAFAGAGRDRQDRRHRQDQPSSRPHVP